MDGIDDSGGGGALGCFAGSHGVFCRAVDDRHFDFGRLVDVEDGIGGPVDAGDMLGIESHLFEKRPARGLDHSSFYLVTDSVEVDDLAGVNDGP